MCEVTCHDYIGVNATPVVAAGRFMVRARVRVGVSRRPRARVRVGDRVGVSSGHRVSSKATNR